MIHRLRTIFYTIYLALGTAVIGLLGAPALLIGNSAARAIIRFWSRTMLWGLKVICGVSWRVEGEEHIPAGPAIIAANHQSMWETIAIFALLSRPVVVFKKELLRIPIYGWWGLASGSIPVDRDAGAKAIRALTRAACARLAAGCQVVVFPEGTRVPPFETRPLQPGVAAIYTTANAPCVPAVHNSGQFWRYPGRARSLKTPGVITLRFYPPIGPGLPRKEFLSRLERQLEAGRENLDMAASSILHNDPSTETSVPA